MCEKHSLKSIKEPNVQCKWKRLQFFHHYELLFFFLFAISGYIEFGELIDCVHVFLTKIRYARDKSFGNCEQRE